MRIFRNGYGSNVLALISIEQCQWSWLNNLMTVFLNIDWSSIPFVSKWAICKSLFEIIWVFFPLQIAKQISMFMFPIGLALHIYLTTFLSIIVKAMKMGFSAKSINQTCAYREKSFVTDPMISGKRLFN